MFAGYDIRHSAISAGYSGNEAEKDQYHFTISSGIFLGAALH